VYGPYSRRIQTSQYGPSGRHDKLPSLSVHIEERRKKQQRQTEGHHHRVTPVLCGRVLNKRKGMNEKRVLTYAISVVLAFMVSGIM